MKAVWAIGRIQTDAERTQAIDFIQNLGFNTFITNSVTPDMVAYARTRKVRVIATVFPYADEDFARQYPHFLQKMRDFEGEIASALDGQPWAHQTAGVFRWQPLLLRKKTMCFEHPESQTELKRRVEEALEIADGIALDGFGFVNHYACFCDRCEGIRAQLQSDHPDRSDLDVLAHMSEQTLINIHRQLYEHAKTIQSTAVVTNHVWPPFRPDEYVGHKFKLDYCTQTISWFYPPVWRLERVEMEAAEMKRLEDPDVNRFVPFIGIHDVNGLVRSPERLVRELEIALKYGDGGVVVSRFSTLQTRPELAEAVKTVLKK